MHPCSDLLITQVFGYLVSSVLTYLFQVIFFFLFKEIENNNRDSKTAKGQNQ